MTFEAYQNYFEEILNSNQPLAPYDNNDYINYTKLNWARMQRWLKTAKLIPAIEDSLALITTPQKWIVITEPWCGDAAHILPFIELIAKANPLVKVDYELRDNEPTRIDSYLTNGGKAIPKLIIQNTLGNDLAVWGPRPEACQALYEEQKAKNADLEQMKIALQQWYNADKGLAIQKEIAALLRMDY